MCEGDAILRDALQVAEPQAGRNSKRVAFSMLATSLSFAQHGGAVFEFHAKKELGDEAAKLKCSKLDVANRTITFSVDYGPSVGLGNRYFSIVYQVQIARAMSLELLGDEANMEISYEDFLKSYKLWCHQAARVVSRQRAKDLADWVSEHESEPIKQWLTVDEGKELPEFWARNEDIYDRSARTLYRSFVEAKEIALGDR
ncbi:hypothetical protein HAHE_12030 [Haloferula helveola]|uniref:Uncharacterized protein n=1 Tax=Haloferula helveola TaxID=490095 RepID=A0ABN6H1A3_9BACT|nr:hypothetical protein HAHE_12030 [Haloferula helveola]